MLGQQIPESTADLFQINDTHFLKLQVINGKQLKKEYQVAGKSIGVVITTKMKDENQ